MTQYCQKAFFYWLLFSAASNCSCLFQLQENVCRLTLGYWTIALSAVYWDSFLELCAWRIPGKLCPRCPNLFSCWVFSDHTLLSKLAVLAFHTQWKVGCRGLAGELTTLCIVKSKVYYLANSFGIWSDLSRYSPCFTLAIGAVFPFTIEFNSSEDGLLIITHFFQYNCPYLGHHEPSSVKKEDPETKLFKFWG